MNGMKKSSSQLRGFIGCITILFILCSIAFLPVFQEGKVIAPMDIQENFIEPWSQDIDEVNVHNHIVSDAVTQYLPYRMFAERAYQEDGYIGWNPYEMGGFNMAGNTMALPGSWTTKLHRFMSFNNAWNFGLIAEFLIAGIGMLVFLRDRKLAWICCLFGAIAFMANSQFIVWIYHRWAIGSFCWMPWVLWASSGIFTDEESKKRHVLLPLFLGLAILGGSLQHIVFIALACGCLVLARFSFRKPFKIDWVYSVKWSVLFFFVFGLISYALIPQIQAYLTNVEIGHTRGGLGYKGGVTQIILNVIAIPAQFWPWLMGDAQTLDGSKLLRISYMSIAYFGTIPMIFAIMGLFKKEMPKAAKWMIVLGLLIPLTPLVGPLYHRVQIVFILGGCWMASEMLACYIKNPPVKLVKYVAAAVFSIGLLLAIGSFLPSQYRSAIEQKVISQTLAKSGEMQFGSDKEWLTGRAIEWTDRFSLHHPQTLLVFSLLVVGVVGLYLLRRNERFGNIGSLVLVVVVTLELGVYLNNWVSYADAAAVKSGHPAITKLKQLTQGARVYQGTGNNGITSSFGAPNILSSYFVPTLDAYESIQYQSVARTAPNVSESLKYTLSNVKYSICPDGAPLFPGTQTWKKVDSIGSFNLYENPDAIPPIVSVNTEKEETIEGIYSQLQSADEINPLIQTMSTFEIEVPQKNRYLRIGQNWHPGWKWRLKQHGEWRDVLKGVDGACWVPTQSCEGEVIELVFHPRSNWTIYLSWFSGFGLVLIGIVRMKSLSQQKSKK